jgi:hypothetical protein
MEYAHCLALGLIGACAASAAVGPTIERGGIVHIQGDGSLALQVPDGGFPTLADPQHGPVDVWLMGFGGSVGLGARLSRTELTFDMFVEYMHVGSPESPYGYHVIIGCGVGGEFEQVPRLSLTLRAGGNRLAAEYPPKNYYDVGHAFVSNGVDLSLQLRATSDELFAGKGQLPVRERPPATPWQLGLFYVRQDTHLYE